MITSPLWLPVTLVAGGVQAWRTAVQRRVGKDLSVNAAGLVRYLYGLPFALVFVVLYEMLVARGAFPAFGPKYWPLCIVGGIGQILGTNFLLAAFQHRGFVVGTAYSKTEAVQSAILSLVLLGDHLGALTWVGIAFGVAGVMILSSQGKPMTPAGLIAALGQPAARLGIASGFCFAAATTTVRAATMEIVTTDHIRAALITLVTTLICQTLMQGGYVVWRERDQVRPIFASWRVSGQVGLLSSFGSACWFTGFATAPVALVRIVGQVEVAFTMGFAHFYLGERMARSEVTGLLLVAAGVVLALAGAR